MTTPLPAPRTVLVFAASDPSCGAGVQADILTLASLGAHPLTAITALTVQDTTGVKSVHPVKAKLLEAQARALLADMPVSVFKAGVLGSVENVTVVANIAAEYPDIPLVLDPVLASGRGDAFADARLRAALREQLLPRCALITPNTLEACRLLERDVDAGDDLSHIAAQLLACGPRHVLITGTHAKTTQVTNTLYGAQGLIRADSWERLPDSYHGSGCTLASGISACLAGGSDMETAVQKAQRYTWQTLKHAFRPGQGQFIPDRLFLTRHEKYCPDA
jgi:hydroxymethylpyrimidine/phosphomethylpyrimidine kinase